MRRANCPSTRREILASYTFKNDACTDLIPKAYTFVPNTSTQTVDSVGSLDVRSGLADVFSAGITTMRD